MCESGGGRAPGALTRDEADPFGAVPAICRAPGARARQGLRPDGPVAEEGPDAGWHPIAALPEGRCVGPQVAAQPTIAAGDSPEGLGGEPSSAMPCGVAPRPAPSGPTARHGLDRGGDRAASGAMRVVAVGRLGADGRARAHVARKMSEGRPRLEATRCVKRHIAREPHRDVIAQNRMSKAA